MADSPPACGAVLLTTIIHHIMPEASHIEDDNARSRACRELGGRLCVPMGAKGLLVPGTPRWRTCVALAEHLARREGEPSATHAVRCERFDAWAASRAFAKPGVALLILWQAAALLGGANLFEGLAPMYVMNSSVDARRVHLHVPPDVRHADRRIAGLFLPGYLPRHAGGGAADDGSSTSDSL